MITQQSVNNFKEVKAEAEKYIAGGVVSLNRKVFPNIVFREGKGSKIYDINGKEYIDYHAAFGPHLLGHNFDAVNDAVIDTITKNISLIGAGTNEIRRMLIGLELFDGRS